VAGVEFMSRWAGGIMLEPPRPNAAAKRWAAWLIEGQGSALVKVQAGKRVREDEGRCAMEAAIEQEDVEKVEQQERLAMNSASEPTEAGDPMVEKPPLAGAPSNLHQRRRESAQTRIAVRARPRSSGKTSRRTRRIRAWRELLRNLRSTVRAHSANARLALLL
jgi:hypothetical protein